MKIITHHLTGNSNVKAALQGFIEADLLEEFHVTVATFPNSWLHYLGAINFLSDVRRRNFDKSLKPFTKTWPCIEVNRLFISKLKLNYIKKKNFFDDKAVQNIDLRVASTLKYKKNKTSKIVYGYEDTTFYSFSEAKKLGIKCYYDLPIGYWRTAHRLLEKEKDRWPEWESTMPGLKDSKEKLDRKDEELKLADRIYVASSFTADTLRDYPGKIAPIEVIPYGFPAVNDFSKAYSNPLGKKKLKVLFVGSLTQRKGIADLFSAVNSFDPYIQLTVIGKKSTNDCLALNKELSKHTWIPSLPHSEILRQMKINDVLIFPSLFEGFGLVITEAMSQGTPVITTDRTAGPDIIEHGENGWLFKAGSTQELKAAIEELLIRPQMIEEVGREAMETARKRPWTTYGKELSNSICNK